jgi:hypothetical protein
MLFRFLIIAIPAILIFLFVREYLKQKRAAEENWDNQWKQKKINFQKERELELKEKEIEKLKKELEKRNKNDQ